MVTEDKYLVKIGDLVLLKVNPALVESKGISDEVLMRIKDVHLQLYTLDTIMNLSLLREKLEDAPKPPEYWKKLNKQAEKLEFKLQELWGFDQDTRFHKFWKRPGCECPILDNEDRYPLGKYIINQECRLHGTD